MIRTKFTDDFYDKQPERLFEEELRAKKPYPIPEIKEADDGFVKLSGAYLVKGTFKNEARLFTVFEDFDDFLSHNGLAGNKYPVSLLLKKSLEKEEFIIRAGAGECKIYASETEGIRRALIRLEDLLAIHGGTLPAKAVHERAKIKRRISRCFFSPTNRPPRNGAELDDGVDYYPDGYLSRLMHDGINGIWIYSSFDALLKSPYITEFGEGSEKRIKKLNSVIEKCERYGIEVFLFVLEPIALTNAAVQRLHPGIEKKYPEVMGNVYHNEYTGEHEVAFCTYTDFARKYCYEAVKRLFTLAPKLGGIISITQGERVTSCSTVWLNSELEWHNVCPYCSRYSKAEILADKLELMRAAMREIKPEAEYVSWTYEHRTWELDAIGEYVEKAPRDVPLMQNFEDNGRAVQLGRKRCAIDYWLSYAGPSEMFEYTARRARELGSECYAKMQVCSSHELASVPYIPTPGIIYDKFTRAKALGVTGVMESWYFGNYPCLMSKAAELLSRDVRFSSKDAFLRALAGLYYAGADRAAVASAWRSFERAYTQYPVNIMFSYYGPMHDGIVWELSLKPKNFSLSRSWLLIDRTDGDRLGECLFAGHTAAEAEELLSGMKRDWARGLRKLSAVTVKNAAYREQRSVAEAIFLLICSALDIVSFYRLRGELGYMRGEPRELLSKMKRIVRREIKLSRAMTELCEGDARLGFHSEAEGYKFFPEKLKARIKHLKTLLKTEFCEVEERISAGLAPLAYYCGEEEGIAHYTAGRDGLSSAEWRVLSGSDARFRLSACEDKTEIELECPTESDFLICPELELGFPSSTVIVKNDGRLKLYRECMTHQSVVDEKIDEELAKWRVERLAGEGTHVKITLDNKKAGFVRLPFKLMIKTPLGASFSEDASPVRTLGKSALSPAEFGWIV